MATEVLSNILGGTTASQLFTEIREKRGLAYSIGTTTTAYRDCGTLKIAVGLDDERLPEALRVIGDELHRFKKEGVTPDELRRAKSNIIGSMALSHDDTGVIADWNATCYLTLGHLMDVSTYYAFIRKVSETEVAEAAEFILDGNRLAAATVGPSINARHFQQVINALSAD
jgi:predicted Zn-dependent peptidase